MNTSLDSHQTSHEPAISPCDAPSKRRTIKIWLQNAFLGEAYDEIQDYEEPITLDDTDDLSLVPSWKKTLHYSTLPPMTFDARTISNNKQKGRAPHLRREKLRNLKNRVKAKLHGLKFKDGSGSSESSLRKRIIRGSLKEAEMEYYNLFGEFPKNLNNLLEDEMTRVFEEDADSSKNFLYCDRNTQGLGPFQFVDESHTKTLPRRELSINDEDNSVRIHPLEEFLRARSFNGKRDLDRELCDDLIKRQCPAKKDQVSEKWNHMYEDCLFGAADSDCESNSIERTPPIFLSRPEGAHMNIGLGKAVDSLKIIAAESRKDQINETCYDEEHDNALSSEVDSCSNCAKVFTIPTFRSKKKATNITSMVSEIERVKLDQSKLNRLAKTGSVRGEKLTFQDKKFYDVIPVKTNDDDDDDNNVDSGNSTGSADSDNSQINAKQNIQSCLHKDNEKSEPRVTFDRYSFLVVYRSTKKCESTDRGRITFKGKSVSSLDSGFRETYLNSDGRRSNPHRKAKSILKRRPNSKEQEETKRASNCDRVDLDSFLEYFEKFESKRQLEGSKLGKCREKQLNHYYSEVFFPELLDDTNPYHTSNNEFAKSKKATELNIGIKIGEMVHTPV